MRALLSADDSKAPLDYARAPSAELPAEWLTVAPGPPQSIELTKIPGTGPLLLVRNPTATVGHYHVRWRSSQ